MFSVSAMNPNSAGAIFDHDYDRERHMSLVAERLGAALRRWTVDKGLVGGGAPGSPPAFIAACALYLDSPEAIQADPGVNHPDWPSGKLSPAKAGMAAHGASFMAGVPKPVKRRTGRGWILGSI